MLFEEDTRGDFVDTQYCINTKFKLMNVVWRRHSWWFCWLCSIFLSFNFLHYLTQIMKSVNAQYTD